MIEVSCCKFAMNDAKAKARLQMDKADLMFGGIEGLVEGRLRDVLHSHHLRTDSREHRTTLSKIAQLYMKTSNGEAFGAGFMFLKGCAG